MYGQMRDSHRHDHKIGQNDQKMVEKGPMNGHRKNSAIRMNLTVVWAEVLGVVKVVNMFVFW